MLSRKYAAKNRRITAPVLKAEKQEKLLSLLSGDLDIPVRQIVDFINR
ncbi:hypothetical protein [Faecalispora anaeroviscerum]|nr:hypothetical protein [Faecalispora anaeroviscerum]